eukprot:2132386-Rhodomonas_salina.2
MLSGAETGEVDGHAAASSASQCAEAGLGDESELKRRAEEEFRDQRREEEERVVRSQRSSQHHHVRCTAIKMRRRVSVYESLIAVQFGSSYRWSVSKGTHVVR